MISNIITTCLIVVLVLLVAFILVQGLRLLFALLMLGALYLTFKWQNWRLKQRNR